MPFYSKDCVGQTCAAEFNNYTLQGRTSQEEDRLRRFEDLYSADRETREIAGNYRLQSC